MQFAGAADAIVEWMVARAPMSLGPSPTSPTSATPGTKPEGVGLPRPEWRRPGSSLAILHPALICYDRICQEI
jgi:hypothetical protein